MKEQPRQLTAACLIELAAVIPVSPDTIQRWAITSGETTAYGVAAAILDRLEWPTDHGKIEELRAIIQKYDEV